MRVHLIVLTLAITLWTIPSFGDESLKDGAKEVGQGFKKMGQETGQALKEGGKEVGQGLGKMGKTVGQEAKEKSRSFSEWLTDTGKKTGAAFKQVGRGIKDFFTPDQGKGASSRVTPHSGTANG